MARQTYQPVLPPYAHQTRALALAADRAGFGLLMEMGTGKTKVFIDNMVQLYSAGRIDRVVVIAPKGVCSNWTLRELPLHVPPGLPWRAALYRAGASRAQLRQIDAVLDPAAPGLAILVVNGEGLSKPGLCRDVTAAMLRGRRCLLCVDEATMFKQRKAARTKWLLAHAHLAPYRRILTGMSVPNGPMDAYSQFEILAPGCLGFGSWYAFRSRFSKLVKLCLAGGCPQPGHARCALRVKHPLRRCGVCRRQIVEKTVGFRNLDELSAALARHSYRVTKDECLDLPPKVYQTREVELTTEQRRAYEEMRTIAQAELDGGGWASAQQVITQLLRLHQITCGHVTDESGQVREIENNLLAAVDEVIDEAQGKIVIWCSYQHDVRRVAAHLTATRPDSEQVVQHYGQTSVRDRDDAVLRIQEDPTCRFFVATAQTGGWGITLTAARTVIYLSNSFDLEKRIQSEDRTHRIGQRGSVTYVDLVARGTVSERVLETLRDKMGVASVLMRDDPREWFAPLPS